MFKRLAAEALGISDIGVIVGPADYSKVDADDYPFSEDGEQVFFLIKSKKDEYCFTNLALVSGYQGDSRRRLRVLDPRYRMVAALKRTLVPFFLSTLVAGGAGWGMQAYAPDARTLGEVLSSR